jgi:acetamidase/formamidase
VFRFVLHKDMRLDTPRAESATHYLAIGIDADLDRALRKAVLDVVDFLVEEHGLTPGEAFTLASLAVDFSVSEAVNETQVVTGSIPKSLFTQAPPRSARGSFGSSQ